MRLWLLTRQDEVDYDEHDSAVIRAADEQCARTIASDTLYPRQIWLGEKVKCTPLDHDGEPGVVVGSFNAG